MHYRNAEQKMVLAHRMDPGKQGTREQTPREQEHPVRGHGASVVRDLSTEPWEPAPFTEFSVYPQSHDL